MPCILKFVLNVRASLTVLVKKESGAALNAAVISLKMKQKDQVMMISVTR